IPGSKVTKATVTLQVPWRTRRARANTISIGATNRVKPHLQAVQAMRLTPLAAIPHESSEIFPHNESPSVARLNASSAAQDASQTSAQMAMSCSNLEFPASTPRAG